MISKRQKMMRQLHELKTQVDHINRMVVEMHRCLPPCDRLYDLLFSKREALQPSSQGVSYFTIDEEFHQTIHRFLVNYGQLRKRSKQCVTEKRTRAYDRFTMLYQAVSHETSQLPLEEGEEDEDMTKPQQRVLTQLAAASVVPGASTSSGGTTAFSSPGVGGEIGMTEPVHINHRYYCHFAGCQASFAQATTARDHVKRVHTKEPLKVFVCNEAGCNYSTDRKFSFDRHQKKHTNDRPYKCTYPMCGKTFKTPATLRDHQYTHADGQDWVCTWPGCNKKFKSPNSLQNHQTRHKCGLLKSDYGPIHHSPPPPRNGHRNRKGGNIQSKLNGSDMLGNEGVESEGVQVIPANSTGMGFHVGGHQQPIHHSLGHQPYHH